ncbi:MAG TPA: tRNA (adenosine(37)-N6)-threonylcarbamoyltransferase complex dimerization subunit type 1 TsaB [Candidatus Saccharimonadales bacterium]|nr:tRNA (adenosine(37)-N6)-threonylcarbamoyltransferase complex dimerization subunit type 1 TsaB [Candidatus Saccharimonadales bacterium]
MQDKHKTESLILTIRTDKPEAEVGLYGSNKSIACLKWQAGRELSADIHNKIKEVLSSRQIEYRDLTGVAFYKGPGSFTGLRIGASVANTIAYELDIPVIGANGSHWVRKAVNNLSPTSPERIIIPEYGSPARTTKPKK